MVLMGESPLTEIKTEVLIQLIHGLYLIHYDIFYPTKLPKNLLCVIIINLKLL